MAKSRGILKAVVASAIASVTTPSFDEAELIRRAVAEKVWAAEQQKDPFGAFEKRVSPEWNWDWPHLRFCRDRIYEAEQRQLAGQLFRLIVCIPPQHGKTEQHSIRYAAYRLSKDPDIRIGIGSYNERRAKKISRGIRKIIRILGLDLDPESRGVLDWRLKGHRGGVVAVGVGGGVAGEPIDLFIADDVIGKKKDAESRTKREEIWDWWCEDIAPRLQANAAVLIVNTRWHMSDLIGCLLDSEQGKGYTLINLPALAEEVKEGDPPDPLGRKPGEALCRDRFDEAALAEKKAVLREKFQTQYQCRPFIRGGSIFPAAKLRANIIPAWPNNVRRVVRGWDKGGTKDGGDPTAGVAMGKDADGNWIIDNVVHGRWAAAERNRIIKGQARLDSIKYAEYKIVLEQEPGSGGKESGEISVKDLGGYNVEAKVTRGKDLDERSEPYAVQVQSGNVYLVAGDWVEGFIAEHEVYPNGDHDDRISAAALAFNELELGSEGIASEDIDCGDNETVNMLENF